MKSSLGVEFFCIGVAGGEVGPCAVVLAAKRLGKASLRPFARESTRRGLGIGDSRIEDRVTCILLPGKIDRVVPGRIRGE